MGVIKPNRVGDLIDATINVCRDESCQRVEIHEAHERVVVPGRGRAPAYCPMCRAPILKGQGPRCPCGWSRKGAAGR